jgi:hypothetical protein
MMNASDFLSSLWGADDQGNLSKVHYIAERTRHDWKHHAVSTIADAVAKAVQISKAGRNAYFACAAFETTANRKGDNAAGAHEFHCDIDCGPDKAAKNEGYATKIDALGALRDFCNSVGLPKPAAVVDSGNGLHTYWYFKDFIPADQWRALARKLKTLAAKHGLRADPTRTADIASVLRVPATMNFKDPAHPKQVQILSFSGPNDFKAFADALNQPVAGLVSNLGAPAQKVGDYPPSSAIEIIKHCPALAHAAMVRGAMSEPLWRNMLGVVKFTTEGAALCHEWSKGDPRYDEDETQRKIDGWTAGPTLCETFHASPDAKCQGCVQKCKSPIQLGWSKDLNPTEAALHELNLRYFVARVGGGVFVFDEQDQSILANGMTFTAFTQFNAGHLVNGIAVAKKWLNSPKRRTYNFVAFDPSGKCPEGSYNTWRGLQVKAVQGNCVMIRDHILNVWCGGNVRQFAYVIRWMALLVQKPWMKPEVALVLRSKEGTGKTIIVQMLLDYFGVHGFTAAQKDQVAGRFNGHLFDKVLVVLEEAFFAGDPAAVAATKALVTNTTLGYEAKGKDAFSAPNYAHVISLTNNEWAVPAGIDARRWMVLDVNEARKGDHSYFTALADEIKNGGAEAFLDCLLNTDLSGWNPRALPKSDALHGQQRETLMRNDPVAGFLLHVLAEGAFTVNDGAVDWEHEIAAADLQESYARATVRARHAPSFDVASKRMRTLLPQGAFTKVRKATHGDRYFSYRLPDLQEARQHFQSKTGVDPCAP